MAGGAQKLYSFFINPPDGKTKTKARTKPPVPDKFWFQDLAAKAVLFQSTEKLYDQIFGRGGGYRALTVCYSVAWLRQLMNPEPVSLNRIWRQQGLTEAMNVAMKAALQVVDDYLRRTAGTRTAREWAVKEECWLELQRQPVPPELTAAIRAVPAPDRAADTPRARQTPEELAREEQRAQAAALTSLGEDAWDAIETWGRQSQRLTPRQLELSGSIARAIELNRPLTESEIKNGHAAIDAVLEHQPDLLSGLEEPTTAPPAATGSRDDQPLTLELLQRLYDWERASKRLTDFHFNMVRKLVREQRLPKSFEEKLIRDIVQRARSKGFAG